MKVLVLDTETLGVADPSVYNFGYLIYDTVDGKTLVERDYISTEIYDNHREMSKAFYKNKIPLYEQRLADGSCKKMKWSYVLRMFKRDINKFKPDGIFAYNSGFDFRAIAKTCEKLGTKTNPTSHGIRDIWKGLTDPLITSTPEYQDFCRRNGYMTKHAKPKVRATAEIVYRYLTGQTEYEEEHTALADSKIECVILQRALAIASA